MSEAAVDCASGSVLTPTDLNPWASVASVEAKVRLLKYPYPYRAMLAVCSDLDETPDRGVYLDIARFLNTTETGAIVGGVTRAEHRRLAEFGRQVGLAFQLRDDALDYEAGEEVLGKQHLADLSEGT